MYIERRKKTQLMQLPKSFYILGILGTYLHTLFFTIQFIFFISYFSATLPLKTIWLSFYEIGLPKKNDYVYIVREINFNVENLTRKQLA